MFTLEGINSIANYVIYLGTSTSPVNIATKTKVATAVFQVNSNASGTISFSVVTAIIDGTDTTTSVGSLTITTPPPTPTPTPTPTTAKVFIEPNKTTVAPGERFAVDISLQGTTAQSALVNFTFDPTKITYVSGSTQGLFNVMDRIDSTANYVRYLGASTSPVSIATKTKVATAVFQVNSNASGTISFSIVTANINGTNASAIVQSLTIVKETWQAYDQNGNGDIEDQELISAIMDWLNNRITDQQLINVILKWLT